MHPVRWDAHGHMAVETYLGDFPQFASGAGFRGWMLLSLNKLTTASSILSGHPTAWAVNEDIRSESAFLSTPPCKIQTVFIICMTYVSYKENTASSAWWSASSGTGWFAVDIGATCEINAVQSNFADQDANHNGPLSRSYEYRVEASADGISWQTVLTRGPPPPARGDTAADTCSAGNMSVGVCLHNADPILRSFGSASQPVTPGECCGNCSETAKCVSWNVNTQMKQCFLRGSYKPNPGKACISGSIRPVPPPPPPAPDAPHDYVELPHPVQSRHIRLTSTFSPANGKFSLSGLRVFGLCPGAPPAAVEQVHAVRDAADGRKVYVRWAAAAGAEFYIIRYGTSKQRLFGNYQVIPPHTIQRVNTCW